MCQQRRRSAAGCNSARVRSFTGRSISRLDFANAVAIEGRGCGVLCHCLTEWMRPLAQVTKTNLAATASALAVPLLSARRRCRKSTMRHYLLGARPALMTHGAGRVNRARHCFSARQSFICQNH